MPPSVWSQPCEPSVHGCGVGAALGADVGTAVGADVGTAVGAAVGAVKTRVARRLSFLSCEKQPTGIPRGTQAVCRGDNQPKSDSWKSHRLVMRDNSTACSSVNGDRRCRGTLTAGGW